METLPKPEKKAWDLTGLKVAIIATDGFEQSELVVPAAALQSAGATVDIVAPESGTIRGWDEDKWGDDVPVNRTLDEAHADDYDGLVLPGGVLNSDAIRTFEKAVKLTREFFDQRKPVAAICHAGQLLIEAEVVDGRTLTSYPSIRKDLENAGAAWKDQEVVVDKRLVSSRSPKDLPAFCEKLCENLYESRNA